MFRRCLGSVVWRLVDVFEVLACRWFKSEKRGFALEGRGLRRLHSFVARGRI